MKEFRRIVTLHEDKVSVTSIGPLGRATCEGPRSQWSQVRAQAEFLAGHRAEP